MNTNSTQGRRYEAFLIFIASFLALVVLGMFVSSRIAIGEPGKQFIVYPTPRPKVIEKTNIVTVTKLVTMEVYISRPTEVPPPPLVVEVPAPPVAEAPPPPPVQQVEVVVAPVAAAQSVVPTAVPPPSPPAPWGEQPTFTTLPMGTGGFANWWDAYGVKHRVTFNVTDMDRDSIVVTIVANALQGSATLCVDGVCASNGGALIFTVAGVQGRYTGDGEWSIDALEGVLTRF